MSWYLGLAFVTFSGQLTRRMRDRHVLLRGECTGETGCKRLLLSSHKSFRLGKGWRHLSDSWAQTLIYYFSLAPLRGGRKRKPYYKEHCSSIGKKKGCERGLRACYHHDLLVIKETKYCKIFVHNCLRSLRASFIFFWTACLPWSSRLVFWMVSDLLCQDKLKKTIFMGILFHENPFLESVSWCQVCERRNRLENLVRDEIGRGGSRTLLSVLESIMIPREEVSKLENRVARVPPLRTLLPPLSAMCWRKGLRHLNCGFISHSALHSQSSALWVVPSHSHDYLRVSLRCSISRLWQEANSKQTL